ncbi:hypothetical protein PkP19E3_12145 [Pseudomonas koreensis]|nr:hypothetical protein PkP19E3_12145 [Pseudomonas koreensis]
MYSCGILLTSTASRPELAIHKNQKIAASFHSAAPTKEATRGLCRSCRRLRSFDFKKQDQKIAACGSSYRGTGLQLRPRSARKAAM